VLSGLIGVLVFMLFYIANDQQKMSDNENGLINAPVTPLPNLDLTTNNAAMVRLQSAFSLDFDTGNKVFNPFEWQKKPDGELVKKATSITQVALVTDIAPLYLIISLNSVTTNELGARYAIGVEKQAADTRAKRGKQQRYVSPGDKPNDWFALLEIKGPPENPNALVLKMIDTGETVSISRDKPFRRVEGYMADLSYELEKKVFRGRRVGEKLSFGGTDYVIFDINQNEVVLTDQSNQKKTPLPFTP
jgi:hypothetical protein